MQQVNFHILENEDHNGKLRYACRLAREAYSQGMKVSIHTSNPDQSSQLDAMLWTFSQSSFIPHAIAGPKRPDWEDYPVQLSENIDESPQADETADALINLRQQPCPRQDQYARIDEVVCSDPMDKQAARDRFRSYRSQGIEPNTRRIS